MKRNHLVKPVTASVFAALICVATMVVNIPIPATKGYINLGDCVILLGAVILGPVYGAAAAGLGSMLSDLLLGYTYYAPGTLVIKALTAMCAALLFRAAEHKIKTPFLPAAIAAECVMTAGYFLYESTVLGYGLAAAAAIPSNLIQAGAAVGLGSILFRLLRGVPVVKRLMAQRKPDIV